MNKFKNWNQILDLLDWRIVEISTLLTSLNNRIDIILSWEWILHNKWGNIITIDWYLEFNWIKDYIDSIKLKVVDIFQWKDHDYLFITNHIWSNNDIDKKWIFHFYIKELTWLDIEEEKFLRLYKLKFNKSKQDNEFYDKIMLKIHNFQLEKNSEYKTLLNNRNWIWWTLDLF